jgi:RecQ family ATP-dependent DNA helicase
VSSPFWHGLAHPPLRFWQSGGVSRTLNLGSLLRDDGHEVRMLRRALSQSLLYGSEQAPSVAPGRSPEELAVLSSLSEILHRSELVPVAPPVEQQLLQDFGEPGWMGGDDETLEPEILDPGETVEILRSWSRTAIPPPILSPIRTFDDENEAGSFERRFWEYVQEFDGGLLRRWSHPQVLFEQLLPPGGERTESRRVDFLFSPPWCEPLAWEIHGEFDTIDRAKSDELRNANWRVFDHILGNPDRKTANRAFFGLRPKHAPQEAFLQHLPGLLDGAWLAGQVDLTLLYLLETGRWGRERPTVSLTVPESYRVVVEEAIRAFCELVNAVERIWGVKKEEGLITGVMRAHVAPHDEADLSISIDPGASAYLESTSYLPPHHFKVRRICVPFDACLPNQTREQAEAIDGLRPKVQAPEPSLTTILHRVFAKRRFRPGQVEGIRHALSGRDSLVLMPTGHGKSLIFQLAAFLLPGTTLVIEAWRALMDDQVRNLQDLGIGRVLRIYHGRNLDRDSAIANLCEAHLAYVSPERIFVDAFQKPFETLLKTRGLDLLVLDEAHAVSEAGHAFRPSYLDLADRVRFLCRLWGKKMPTMLGLTATAADLVLRDTCGILGIPNEPVTLPSDEEGRFLFVRENLKDEPVVVDAGGGEDSIRRAYQRTLAKAVQGGKGIVFCASKKNWFFRKGSVSWFGVNGTIDQSREVVQEGTPLFKYLGGEGMSPEEREMGADKFKSSPNGIMFATSAFGTGVDARGVRWVLHLGLPAGLEAYYQELGRAGRDGLEAMGYPIFDLDSREVLDGIRQAEKEPDSFRPLQEIADYGARKGSLARQLQFLVGRASSVNFTINDLTKCNVDFMPSFPGWRFEAENIDKNLIGLLRSTPLEEDEIEVAFAEALGPFVWKAIHRLRELGVIRPDYRRTFKLKGLNSFYVTREDLSAAASVDGLAGAVERVVMRMRGVLKATEVGERLRSLLEAKEDEYDRIELATRTLLRNSYEVIRECRVSSLLHLYTYMTTEDQGARHKSIEDYFTNDAFRDRIFELSDSEPSSKVFGIALEECKAQPYWRTGVFQRAAQSFIGAPLPNFLLMLGASRSGRYFEAGIYCQRLLRSESVSPELMFDSLEMIRTAIGGDYEVVLKAIEETVDGLSVSEAKKLRPWILMKLPDNDASRATRLSPQEPPLDLEELEIQAS